MDAVQLIQSVGVPVGLLLILLVAMWRTLQWSAMNIIKPWTERHIAFLDRVEKTVIEQAIVLAAVIKIVQGNEKALEELVVLIKKLHCDKDE